MLGVVIPVVGLAALCGGWFLVQEYFRRHDPEQPGPEGCVGCGGGCHRD